MLKKYWVFLLAILVVAVGLGYDAYNKKQVYKDYLAKQEEYKRAEVELNKEIEVIKAKKELTKREILDGERVIIATPLITLVDDNTRAGWIEVTQTVYALSSCSDRMEKEKKECIKESNKIVEEGFDGGIERTSSFRSHLAITLVRESEDMTDDEFSEFVKWATENPKWSRLLIKTAMPL